MSATMRIVQMEKNIVEIIPIYSRVVNWVSSVSVVAGTGNKGPLPVLLTDTA